MKMKTAEDTQQMLTEAIQSNIPVAEIREAVGATHAEFSAMVAGEAQMSATQFAAVVRLMRTHQIEGWV